MANGRVITGFSKPWVALYANSGSTVTYSDGVYLARGVDVNIDVEVSEGSSFYADNILSESAPGVFTGGTLGLTVDGLLPEIEAMILGLPAQETITIGASTTVKIQPYGSAANPPYVGVGFVVRYMSAGVTSYVPVVITKCRFNQPSDSASTQEDEIDWQTQSLEAKIMQDDSTAQAWKRVGEPQDTEAEAEAVVQAILTPAT